MLLPRFLTALVGVPLLLLSIWWGQIPFFVLIFGVIMLSLHEFFCLTEEGGWPVSKKIGMVCGAVLALSIFLFGTKTDWVGSSSKEMFFAPISISFLLILLVVLSIFSRFKEDAFLRIGMTWLGIWYTAWNLSHILLIRELRPGGMKYTFFLFVVIWALDSGAYFGGKKFGQRQLTAAISPKKTWEGVLFGSFSAFAVSLVFRVFFLRELSLVHTLLLALVITVFAQLSDLSESLFKRNVNVKDSGQLLPGHGGILDRFDSFLLTAPLYYYLLIFFVVK